jgi:hypothetical protein
MRTAVKRRGRAAILAAVAGAFIALAAGLAARRATGSDGRIPPSPIATTGASSDPEPMSRTGGVPAISSAYVGSPPGPSNAADARGGSVLVAAEEYRLAVCDCETRDCIDAENRKYVRALGQLDPSTASAASRAEMHAANACIADIARRWRAASP